MPAPAIVLNPPNGPFTYTLTPIVERGWRIQGTVTQQNATSNWTYALTVVIATAAEIDDEDEAHSSPRNGTLVFNEYPSIVAVYPRIQEIVDDMFDNLPVDA